VSSTISFKPLTIQTWKAFETLFGPKGACGGCWCMTWRFKKAEFEKHKGDGNKKAIYKLVKENEPIGMIAFAEDHAVGWCAVAPRGKYVRLENSRVLRPLDDKPVWSVSCFFIAKQHRRKGLSVKLLKATLAYAHEKGAKIVEAYPVEPKDDALPDVFAWTGILSTFSHAGFKQEQRHSPSRPTVRYYF
jgi:GNAT superfamily N-acetyltransferase